METDTKNKWPIAILVIAFVLGCLGLALREATLFGWL